MKLLVLCDDARDGHGLRAALEEQFREHKQSIAWLKPGGAPAAEFAAGDEPVLIIDCLGGNGNPCFSWLTDDVVAQWLARCNGGEWIWLLVSDSRVFPAAKRRFIENDAPAPASETGKRLLARERFIADAAARHIILRTGPIIAGRGENLLTRMLAQLRTGKDVMPGDTQRFCPTPAADVARVIAAIHDQLDCGANGWGIYHYESADAANGFEFAEVVLAAAAQYWPLVENTASPHAVADGGVEISTEDIFPLLNCHRLRDTFGIQQLPWRKAIPALLKQIHSNDSAETVSS